MTFEDFIILFLKGLVKDILSTIAVQMTKIANTKNEPPQAQPADHAAQPVSAESDKQLFWKLSEYRRLQIMN